MNKSPCILHFGHFWNSTGSLAMFTAPQDLFLSYSHLGSHIKLDQRFLSISHLFVSFQCKSFCLICPSPMDWFKNLFFLQKPTLSHPSIKSVLILWAESIIQLFNAYLLSIYYMPGTDLEAAGNIAVNQTDKSPSLWKLAF